MKEQKKTFSENKKNRLLFWFFCIFCIFCIFVFLVFRYGGKFLDYIGVHSAFLHRYFINQNLEIDAGKNNLLNQYMEALSDLFQLVWATTIAVAIFVLEMSSEYETGISIKMKMKKLLPTAVSIAISVIYLFDCPLFYIGKMFNCYNWSLICLSVAFSGLCVTIIIPIIFSSYRINSKFLIWVTCDEFKDSFSDCDYEKISIAERLESLPVSEVLKNIDYDSIDDLHNLLDMLSKIISNIKDDMKPQVKHVILYNWYTNIILRYDIRTQYQKEMMISIGIDFWDKMLNTVEGEDDDNRISALGVSFSFQILQPFLCGKNDQDMSGQMWSIWERMSFGDRVLPYLLLYTHYRYLYTDSGLICWWQIRGGDLGDISISAMIKKFLDGYFEWDEKLGLELWLSWSCYRKLYHNLGLIQFKLFKQDICCLETGQLYNLNTPVLKRFYLEMRDKQ